MFGFPIGNGNAGFNDFVEKFTNDADSGFPKIQQREVFYSIKDGNWNDISIWETASGRVGLLPTANDNVYIRNNIAANIDTTIYKLFVSGIFTINASITLGLNSKFIGAGNSQLINKGTLNFLTQISAEQSYSNGIFDFTTNANTIQYGGNYTATIPSYFTTFHNLTISGTGTKSLGVNTTLNGALNILSTAVFDCATYNLNVTGTTTIGLNGASFIKSGAGNILFIGNVTGSDGVNSNFILSGNPNVEFRGGFTTMFYAGGTFNSGTGTWTFTTNNQTIIPQYNPSGGYVLNCDIIIVGITLTIALGNGGGFYVVNKTIDGTNASSILNLSGRLHLNNATQVLPMYTNGTFNPTFASSSLLGFTFNGNYTIPFTTFNSVITKGTGIKSLSGNTSVGFLSVELGTFECGIYNLSNSGLTFLNGGVLSKNGSGNILLGSGISSLSAAGGINFTGNPNVEVRGNITNGGNGFSGGWVTGTGTWTFSTNSSAVTLLYLNLTWNCNLLVSGPITLTMSSGTNNTFTFVNQINGDNALSKFLVGASTLINYQSATQPMVTGILDTSTNLNTWIYGLNNQDIKGSPTISPKQVYRNLTLNGTGVKTLQGYVSVLNTYTLTAPATLALNGFTLTNP